MKIVIGEKGHIKQDYYSGSATYKRISTGDTQKRITAGEVDAYIRIPTGHTFKMITTV